MAVELYTHQREAVNNTKNGSIIAGGVGSGKTITSLAYYVEQVCGGSITRNRPMKTPKDVVIITTAKKRDDLDWEKEAVPFGIFRDKTNSYSGVSISVDSWNNVKKYSEDTGKFFIFDEQRIVGNGAWVKAFLKIAKNNEWILLSATPADTWLDYLPVFLAHGFFRTRTEFMDEHVVWTFHGKYRKIRGFYNVSKLKKFRDQVLVEMPFERHTTRHLISTMVEFDEELFRTVWKKRWNVYDDCPLIDSAEMHRIGRKVVNSSPDRLKKIEELSKKHPKLIIFYNFDYELEALRTLKDTLDIEVAEWNGHKHQPVPLGDRWLYLVQYQAGAEGWNCITTDAMVFYSLTYSHKIFEQTQGRTDRINTPFKDLWYYVLMSDSKIDKIIWLSLIAKKNFHEGRLIKF